MEIFDKQVQFPNGKGGLLGALLGTLLSLKLYRPNDKPLARAGKTAAAAGTGYLIGDWFEQWMRRLKNSNR